MFIVKVTNKGNEFFLRGTVWAFHADRADKFNTEQAAVAALEKARQFMKPSFFKLARIEAV